MALLKWNEDEEKKDDEFESPIAKTIQSVQSGWQPTQDAAVTEDGEVESAAPEAQNYLVSEQKANFDHQVQQQRANEEAARVRAANEAADEANRRAAAVQQIQTESLPQNVTPVKTGAPREIPGFSVMSPKAQQEALRSRVFADQQAKAEESTKFWGNVPVIGTMRNWGAGLASVVGKATGNRELQARADNERKLLTLGMNTQQFNAYDEKTRNKLETLQTGVTGLGALDAFGVASLAKMPLVAGLKAAAKEGLTSQAGRQILKEAAQQTGQQYGKNVAVGAGVSAIADPAVQAYVKDGDVDWSSIPSSMLQGGLWAAAIPEFSGKARLTQKLQSGGALTPEDSLEINSALATEAAPATPAEQTPRVADGIVTPIRDGNLAFDNKTENSETPIEIPAFQDINPIADNFTPANQPAPTPAAGNLTPVQPPVIDMPQQLTPDAPLPLEQLAERATLDNVTPATNVPVMPAAPAPVADGTVLPNIPVVKSDEVRALQESRAGTSQAEEAQINQQLQNADTPEIRDTDTQLNDLDEALERGDISYDEHARMEDEIFARENAAGRAMAEDGNLPDDMNTLEVPAQPSREALAERMISRLDEPKELKQKIANAVGMKYDKELPIADILAEGKGSTGLKDAIARKYGALNAKIAEYNDFQNKNRDAFTEGGAAALDSSVSRQRSKLTGDLGRLERDLVGSIRRLEGRNSIAARTANVAENLTGMRNANMLSSVGGLERNLAQETGANIAMSITHPYQMIKSTFGNGNLVGDALKNNLKEWTVPPHTISEVPRYIVGNAYRTAMTLTTAGANARKGIMRENIARLALEVNGEKPSAAEIKKFANAMGNEAESLVNVLAGVANGMSHHKQATEALNDYKQFMKTGSDADKAAYIKRVAEQTNVARELAEFVTRGDRAKTSPVNGQQATLADSLAGFDVDNASAKTRIVASMINLVMPFVTTPRNLVITAVRQNLNPVAKSLPDEILKDIRSNPQNLGAILRQKAVDYGVIGGAAALVYSGVVGYNNGDEVDKPRGVWLDMGDGNFVPLRAMAFETPIAAAVTAATIAKDSSEGKLRDAGYYAGMIGSSLPYVDTMKQSGAAVTSLADMVSGGGEAAPEGDNGYAAKSYAVNLAKSFVPFSNNGVNDGAIGLNGESVNAKSTYDKDSMLNSFTNTVRKSYDPAFRDTLKDSRDNAGRVRTVDNQGVIINKTINDKDTATHNDTIDTLVNYGRDNKLGKGTADMFNTYDTGKNNSFKSVQDTITFLDANGKPDASKKLENNAKIGVLAAQIRDGFYGDTGNDLLTLDGKNLYSDVSIPNSSGTKNSRLPLNMQTIKNAVAATDLPEAARNRMYEISQANTALYSKVESKEWTYAKYKEAKAASEQEYVQILSASPSYKKMVGLMDTLKSNGFFNEGGLGSTKSGQTYLWNSLNALLGSKGATPAANYPETSKGFTPWGRRGGSGSGSGSGSKNTAKNGKTGTDGVKWTPAGKRQMASVASGKYTPVNIRVKLGNEIKKNRTQNYADRSF